MASAIRRASADLDGDALSRFRSAPWRFDVWQAGAILEAWKGRMDWGVPASDSIPAGVVRGVAFPEGGAPRLDVNLLGLAGMDGPLPPHVALLVREHEQHLDNPILFPSPRTGGYWSPDAVSRINRKLLAKAGIEEHVRFHDLRHTFATMALSSGVDVKTLSSMLGHYSAGFTLDTYTHITNDMQRGAAEKIGGFIETATAKPESEPPDPPEESWCKVIPFERVG